MSSAVITVVGHVGFIRTFENDDNRKTVCFSVAVDQCRNGQQDEKAPPVWYVFRAVNGTAEVLSQYLQKGRLIHVAGVSPRVRSYEIERTLSIKDIGNVAFKDTRQEVEYLAVDVRFLDAPPATNKVADGELIQAELVASGQEDDMDKEAAQEEAKVEEVPF